MDPNNTQLPATPPPPPSPKENAKKILIVEDEKPISDLYSYILTKEGYRVEVSPDGKTGLDMLAKNQYDLLLLDIMLPGVNGLELLRQWKMQNPNSSMVVLLLTNLGQDAVIKEAFGLGASGYLIKASLTPNQVLTEVNNALASIQQQNSPSDTN